MQAARLAAGQALAEGRPKHTPRRSPHPALSYFPQKTTLRVSARSTGATYWCHGSSAFHLQPRGDRARMWCHGATGARHHTEASLTPRRLVLYHRVFTGGWLDAGGHGPRRAARLVMSCSPIFGSTGFLRQLAPLLVPSTGAKARARFTCNHAGIERTCGAVVPVVPGTRESPSP